MYKTYQAKGIVIKRRNHSEADKILTIFTQFYGKKNFIAKGIRRINSRRSSHLELFRYISMAVYKGKTFDLITEAATIRSFQYLKSDLYRLASSYQVVEVIDRICPENESHEDIFMILLQFLTDLEKYPPEEISERSDKICSEILWVSGYLPRGQYMTSVNLRRYLEHIFENKMKSYSLQRKI